MYLFHSINRQLIEENMTEKVHGINFKARVLVTNIVGYTSKSLLSDISIPLLGWREGVSISWQSMSGKREKINDIIALTTRFSYLNWRHQLKLFHSFLQ